MPSTSITMGSHNMQNNYYNFFAGTKGKHRRFKSPGLTIYPGPMPTFDSPLSAPSANEPVISSRHWIFFKLLATFSSTSFLDGPTISPATAKHWHAELRGMLVV